MDKHLDLTTDWLADAALTPEEREIWNVARGELKAARLQIHDFALKIKTLEKQLADEEASHAVLPRTEFNREVARMLAFDERYGGTSSILYFDIDNLPDLIASCERPQAEATLKHLCDILTKAVRSSDILGRLAVDEFGLFLVRCDNEMAWKRAETMAEIFQKTLAEGFPPTVAPSVSYGAYTFQKNERQVLGLKQVAENLTRKLF